MLSEPDSGEGVEEAFVEVVGDSTPVLDFAEHVADRRPRHAALDIHVVEMVLHELHARVEIFKKKFQKKPRNFTVFLVIFHSTEINKIRNEKQFIFFLPYDGV